MAVRCVVLVALASLFAYGAPQGIKSPLSRCKTRTLGLRGVNRAAMSRRVAKLISRQSATTSLADTQEYTPPGDYWSWRGHKIRYRMEKSEGSESNNIVILVHGFGGNCEHWRKNLPEVSTYADTYAIDLLGFGLSDKPKSEAFPSPDQLYTFETWGLQLRDFAREVAGANPNKKVHFICNSVGSVAGLQAALIDPEISAGVMMLDPSLRLLHWRKQFPLQIPLTSALQTLLRETDLGKWFFSKVATPEGVRSVLKQAYHNEEAVTDELVSAILNPGLLPGAVDVFLNFISYSGGPLPEDLVPQVNCPVRVVWGEKDPWEPIQMGQRVYENLPNIDRFIVLPEVGHCPMDEAPELVNPLIKEFVTKSS
mmetsp:Transcript_12688/g.19004  ORF Transcript_12688/g.19004 Transcript_12688/m.19004 type:complete len:368 (+) Transcript_12688:139-1242(+)